MASSRSLGTPTQVCGRLFAVLLALALAAVTPTAAQQPLERFSLDNGLSQATVLAIHEDSRGFVWLGTEDGLNRFDGTAFHVYRRDPADPSSLPSGYIRALDEDADGNLWIGTEGGGVARWDPRTDRFVRYRNDRASASPRLSSDYVQALLVDGDGAVWIGLRDGGLERLDPVSGEVTSFRHQPGDATSLGDDGVTALAEGAGGGLWVGTRAGVDRLDPATGSFESRVEGGVRSLLVKAGGDLWIGHDDGGLSRLEPATGRLERYRHDPTDPASLVNDQVRALAEDREGRLWVGTLGGLDRMESTDAGASRFAHVGRAGGVATGLGAAAIVALHADRSGALWIGTNVAGAARWDERRPAFAHHRVSPDAAGDDAPPDIVTSFAEDGSGGVWVGTFGTGLVRVDRSTGAIERLRHDPADSGSLSDDRVMALLTDRSGRLWVGTKKGGLGRLDGGGGFTTFRHDPDDSASLGANGVTTLFEDPAGALWAGTFGGGLSRIDPESGEMSTFRHDPADDASLASNRVLAVEQADGGRLWVGTDGGGLALFDPATGRARAYRHRPGDPSSLPSDTVMALFRDPSGALWVGTMGGGLARLDPRLDSHGDPGAGSEPAFTTWSERDGLPNSVVYAIRPDATGGLWMSTNHGLSRFDPATGGFTNFDVSHGLQANEFNFGAAYRSAGGELFFGGINGYNAFQPERLMRLAAERAAPATRHTSDAPPTRVAAGS